MQIMESEAKTVKRQIIEFIGIFAAYFVLAKLGLMLATLNQSVSPFWPAAGVALGAVTLFGRRALAPLFLAAASANLSNNSPLFLSLGIGLGTACEAWLGAQVYSKILKRGQLFEHQAEAFAFVAASTIGAAVSASVGSLSLYLLGGLPLQALLASWVTWWVGDSIGALVVFPVILSLATQNKEASKTGINKWPKVGIFVLALAASAAAVAYSHTYPFVFLVFPILLHLNFYSSTTLSRLFVLGVTVLSILLTFAGYGPFVRGTTNQNIVYLQLFLSSFVLTGLLVSAFAKSGTLKLPALILKIGWVLTVALFFSFEHQEKKYDQAHFQELVTEAQKKMEVRFASYEEGLRGGVSLFAASDNVTSYEWRKYFKSLKLDKRYPGIKGLGYIEAVSPSEIKRYAQRVSIEDGHSFKIKSLEIIDSRHRSSDHFVIRYVEPIEENAPVLGFDISTESHRRQAAELARDSASSALSSKIAVYQDEKQRPGFLMFLPVYRNGIEPATLLDRRKNLQGFVYAVFVAEQFFQGFLGNLSSEVAVVAFDGASTKTDDTLFNSNAQSGTQFERISQIQVAQHAINMAWYRLPGFVSRRDATGAWVAACGALLSLLLASLVVSLQTMRQRAESMADLMPQIVWTIGSDFETTYFNQQWWNYTGFNKVEYRKEQSFEVIHADDRDRVLVIWKHSLESGDVFETEYRLKRADGVYRWHLGRLVFSRANDGRVTGGYGTATDIDDQKYAQKERTALLVREQSALESSRMKSQFMANMSHEIRTPINGIIGMAGILLDTSLVPEQREYADNIRNSGDHLLGIVNDILDFSKIEANKLEIENLDFDLKQVCEDTFKSMEVAAKPKNIAFNFNNEIILKNFMKGDPGRVRQVLSNLLSNGIKFTEKGHVNFKVSLEDANPQEVRLRFEVEDSGIGISALAHPRMFQAFTQADASMNRRFGGTGLGLSISRRLVELMGGKMGMFSEEGKGSTFWFTLTFLVGEILPKKSEIPFTTLPKIERRRVRILLAEDNAINQKVALKQLEKLGYTADIAANGFEVIAALRNLPYDLILMDCQMPEMDGFAATRSIRLGVVPDRTQIPIIAMTANALKGDRDKCLAIGMDDYVSKPVSVAILGATIERWLSVKNIS